MEIRSKKAHRELEALSLYLKGEVFNENGIQVLKIDSSLGKGQVSCVSFKDGLIAMEFDITLNEDHVICIDSKAKDMVHFLYCLKGNSFHKFKKEALVTKIKELQTAVVSSGVSASSQLIIRKQDQLIFNIIRLDKKRYSKKHKWDIDGVEGTIDDLLSPFNSNQACFHLGKFNLEIGELIKNLENAKCVNDLSSLIHFQGICHLIFAKQVEQFNVDVDTDKAKSTTLLKRELHEIVNLIDFIKNYPEIQHSVTSLCSKSGLSASKLQLGFKFINNMTVGEFIRDVRLIRSEILIRTTEMNISEVVYSIGLTSRSYFCKIFKQKYYCSPKQYKGKVVKPSFQITA